MLSLFLSVTRGWAQAGEEREPGVPRPAGMRGFLAQPKNLRKEAKHPGMRHKIPLPVLVTEALGLKPWGLWVVFLEGSRVDFGEHGSTSIFTC